MQSKKIAKPNTNGHIVIIGTRLHYLLYKEFYMKLYFSLCAALGLSFFSMQSMYHNRAQEKRIFNSLRYCDTNIVNNPDYYGHNALAELYRQDESNKSTTPAHPESTITTNAHQPQTIATPPIPECPIL